MSAGERLARQPRIEKSSAPEKLPHHKIFKQQLVETLDLLSINPFATFNPDLYKISNDTRRKSVRKAELRLFQNLFELNEHKNRIEAEGKKPKIQKTVGALGALGSGKTTLMKAFVKSLKGEGEDVDFKKEPQAENPFWQQSEKNKKYMLRSQVFFFLSNSLNHLDDSKFSKKPTSQLSISDTSVFTDVLLWASSYNHTGQFPNDEYEVYLRLFKFFLPILPKPDLMIALGPKSGTDERIKPYIDKIKKGVRARYEKDKSRVQEEKLLRRKKFLWAQSYIAFILGWTLERDQNIPTLYLEVDPIELFRNKKYKADLVEKVKAKLREL